MLKKSVVRLVLAAVVLLGVVSALSLAQGRPPAPCTPDGRNLCDGDPQFDAYRYGGLGFVNPRNGDQWHNQQRGNMRQNRGVGENGLGFFSALPPASDVPLTEEQVEAMVLGYLDEMNAYAFYQSIIDTFGEVLPFVAIQRAEAQHAAAWELLFERYDVALPDVPQMDIETFDTLASACRAAADIEVANFGMYDKAYALFAGYPDVQQVVLALRNASEFNHLPAFERCAR